MGRIKFYRLKNNFSQEEVAIKSGLDRCTINRYENNIVSHAFSLENINRIARAIGVNPIYIYADYLSFISKDYGHVIKGIRKN